MKLRIRDNSIRLRLTQNEVAELGDRGVVEASTGFPGGGTFRYVVESSPASVAPAASFAGDTLRLRLPESTVTRWAGSEEVSIAGEQQLDNGERLSLLVEKDFACLAPRAGEDESDMYPNPQAGTND